MENPQEHRDRLVRLYGSIYGFSSEFLIAAVRGETSLNEFIPQGTANLQSSINAKDSLGEFHLLRVVDVTLRYLVFS